MVSYKDLIISSAITFEVDRPDTKSKLLHKIASGIQGDGLKIKRIAVFEKPFFARIYIEDLNDQPKFRPWYRQLFMPKANPDIDTYDYLVSLSIRELSLFKLTCAYSIEHRNYSHSRKPHIKTQVSHVGKHIRQSVSESISTSLKSLGVRLLTSIGSSTSDNTTARHKNTSMNTVPLPMSGIST